MKSAKSTRHFTRRQFLQLSGLAAGSTLLAACAPTTITTSVTLAPTNITTTVPPTPTQYSAHATAQVVATHHPVATSGLGGWSGSVRDGAGAPLINARVTLIGADGGFFREVRTNEAGQYSIPDAPAGSFVLGASTMGYEYQEATDASTGLDFSLGRETNPGRWTVIGDTEPESFGGTNSGVLMPNGWIIYCHNTVDPLLFNPATGEKRMAKGSPSIQGCHMVTYLPDGRVFYVGGGEVDGAGNFNNVAVDTVKAYDPESNSWEVFPSLSEKRWYPGLTRLADGRFLIFGGGGQPEQLRIASCEIFDPATRRFSPTGAMTVPGGFGPTMLLLTGEVFVAWFPPQLYNIASGQWRNTGLFKQAFRNANQSALPIPADHPDFSAIMLNDGRVAIIGLRRTAGSVMVEVYDPTTETWSLGTNPEVLRSMPEVLQLPTGKILVAGGKNESDVSDVYMNTYGETRLTDLYDPYTGSWQRMNDMKNAREYHAITLLAPDGRVITAAGTDRPGWQPPPTASKEIEAFEPPYLFRGPRPRIESLSTASFTNGASFTFTVSRTSAITTVILIGLNAITHWMDGGVPRRLALPFTQSGETVTATIPSDSIQAMPGFYLLFVLVDDIPSEGQIVQVE